MHVRFEGQGRIGIRSSGPGTRKSRELAQNPPATTVPGLSGDSAPPIPIACAGEAFWKSRRPDSNRGPLHYERWTDVAPSRLQFSYTLQIVWKRIPRHDCRQLQTTTWCTQAPRPRSWRRAGASQRGRRHLPSCSRGHSLTAPAWLPVSVFRSRLVRFGRRCRGCFASRGVAQSWFVPSLSLQGPPQPHSNDGFGGRAGIRSAAGRPEVVGASGL